MKCNPAVAMIIGALPAIAASFFLLSITDVGRNVWAVQAGAVLLMLAIVAVMSLIRLVPSQATLAVAAGMGVVLCALPLLAGGSAPTRWLRLGPVVLYIAPMVIPAMLAVAAVSYRWGARWESLSMAGLGLLAVVLALQPDLSQVLALAAAAGIIVIRNPAHPAVRILLMLVIAAAVGFAALQVDPLSPVRHVEQVIRVAWAHSTPVGVAVSLSAAALVITVAVFLSRVDARMASVAAYYAVLFACSVADLTPAPLIGYGAGPLLGYGLLAGMAAMLMKFPVPHAPLPTGERMT